MLFSCFVEVIVCPNKRVSQHVFGKKITGCILHRVTSPVNYSSPDTRHGAELEYEAI